MKNIDAKIATICLVLLLSAGVRKGWSQTPDIFFPNKVELPFTTDDFFTFMWTDTNLIYAPYTFTLSRVVGQSTVEVYSATNIREYYINYPWDAPYLEEGSYVWSVGSMSGSWSRKGGFFINQNLEKIEIVRSKNYYTELREKLDGSFQRAFDKWLYIHYSQFYATQGGQGLRFVVRDEQHNEIARTDERGVPDGSCPVPVVPISYGENYLVIKLDRCLAIENEKYYYLEVWNEKDEHLYLRFWCYPSLPIFRIALLNP